MCWYDAAASAVVGDKKPNRELIDTDSKTAVEGVTDITEIGRVHCNYRKTTEIYIYIYWP